MPTRSSPALTNDSFQSSPMKRATRLLGPSLAVRIAARLRRGMLDRALTDGVMSVEVV